MIFLLKIIIASLLLCSCSASRSNIQSGYCENEIIVAHGVLEGAPIKSSSSFSIQNEKIVALVTCHDFFGGHNLRWEWYAPDGVLYQRFYLPAGEGKTYVAWNTINMPGSGCSHCGRWKVSAYLDGNLLGSSFFSIYGATRTREQPTADPDDFFEKLPAIPPQSRIKKK